MVLPLKQLQQHKFEITAAMHFNTESPLDKKYVSIFVYLSALSYLTNIEDVKNYFFLNC